MSYIGNTQNNQNYVPAIDYFNGNGSTVAFTLSRPVASVAAVQAVINNVPQNPGDAFTVSGSTITFTSAPPSGTNNIYVYYTSPNTQVVQPGQGTVGTNELANGGVTTAKLSSTIGTGAVALASLPSFTTTIGVGGATASASGSGITFPVTQSASSDANTLDDYEEGTWTPVVAFGGGTTGQTYAYQAGQYIKIGRMVYLAASFNITNIGSSTGNATLGNLPFVPDNVSTGSYIGDGTTAYTGAYIGLLASGGAIYFANQTGGGGGTSSWANMNQDNFNAAGGKQLSICYRTSA